MIAETHREIEITLLEDENVWRFTANGRERTAPTLPKAREYIDNALDKVGEDKAKKWKPIPAYYCESYSGSDFQLGSITSIAEPSRYNRSDMQAWLSTPDAKRGTRCKKSLNDLYAVTPKNSALIEKIKATKVQVRELENQVRKYRADLTVVTLPKEATD